MFSWFPLHLKIEIKMYLNFKKILICFVTWIVIKVSSRVKVSSFFCEQHVIISTLHVYRMSLLIAHRVHIIGVQWGGRVLNEGDDKVKGIRALVFSVPKLLCSSWKFCLWGDVENSYKNIYYEFQYSLFFAGSLQSCFSDFGFESCWIRWISLIDLFI